MKELEECLNETRSAQCFFHTEAGNAKELDWATHIGKCRQVIKEEPIHVPVSVIEQDGMVVVQILQDISLILLWIGPSALSPCHWQKLLNDSIGIVKHSDLS